MTKLHELREIIKAFYGKYTVYINYGLKGLVALIIYFLINYNLNFHKGLSNPFILILLGVFSAVLPWKFITLAAITLVLIQLNSISIWYAVLAGILLFMMFLLYFHISLESGIFLVLMPLAFFLKIPYVVPILVGLLSSPADAFGVAFGIVFYNVLVFAKGNLLPLTLGTEKELSKIIESLGEAGRYIFKNPLLIMYILVFSAVVVIVYIIKRLSVKHSWLIAIGAGHLVMILVLLIGVYRLDLSISLLELFLGIIVSVIINVIVMFFAFNVDYAATEQLQFEDDEYYYYVKAVPKISISVGKRKVQRITAKKPNSVYKTDDIDPEKGVSRR